MVFLEQRIGRLLKELETYLYPVSIPIEQVRYTIQKQRLSHEDCLDNERWAPFEGQAIPCDDASYLGFAMDLVYPEALRDRTVVYAVETGHEGGWDALHAQLSVLLDGKMVQGLDVNHRRVVLSERAQAGEAHRLVLCAYTGVTTKPLHLKSWLRVLDREAEKYYFDLLIPDQVAQLLNKEEQTYAQLILALNESLNLVDFRTPEGFKASLPAAQEALTQGLYARHCGHTSPRIACVGHTHIDVAWLWPLRVTEDKAVRSFSTVIKLMEEYPEYVFMSSQPQLYKYVQKHTPDVFERIRARVAEGRWEAEGAMFVEADCNIASGEALVRQILYGKQYFQREFGVENQILWLPDVFGYSAALPQILRQSDIPYFMTTKISWSEFNKMPCDTFEWEGIDGSRVLTHFIPSRDYVTAENPKKRSNFSTYNATLGPSQVMGGWQRYQQKHLNDEALMSFGFGDGGGGPTYEMLEAHRRLALGIPGCPRTEMSTSLDFFKRLDADVTGNKYLPIWSGELYLEYHRGTYTSMARNKRYNRKAEFALQNAERFAVLSRSLAGSAYPQEKLAELWEVLMRNQFHDILPGSSIKEVYEDSTAEYEHLNAEVGRLSDDALAAVTAQIDAASGAVVVYTPGSFPHGALVTFEYPEAIQALRSGDLLHPCQRCADGRYVVFLPCLAANGYSSFQPVFEAGPPCDAPVIDGSALENRFFRVVLGEDGSFLSIYDKRARRELVSPGGRANQLVVYEDKPHNHDAWDINNYYVEKSWTLGEPAEIVVEEQGSVRCVVKVARDYLASRIVQRIILYRDVPRIDVACEIDWHEKQQLVKALFPLDIRATEATYEIQFGNVKRPTHHNTSWDFARFEVCHHKWLDVSEDGYGASLLNDCKFGAHVHDGVIGLTLLKSATHPNVDADREFHTFTYSLMPHEGGWREAGTVWQAYALNNPPVAQVKRDAGVVLPQRFSLASLDCPNVVLEVVKQAEETDALVLRLYECYNRRTQCTLSLGLPVREAYLCNLMERHDEPVDCEADRIALSFRPYEIKTLKLYTGR